MDHPKVIEQFILSKHGDIDSCEDHIHIGNSFIAVFDGVTSKAIWHRKVVPPEKQISSSI